MRKYIEIGKITFRAELAYRFDVFVGILLSIFRIFLGFILWSALFQEKSEIGGFTFNMMVTYYIIISFFSKLDTSEGIVGQLSSEIRQGKFSKYLVQPLKPLGYFISCNYARTLFIFFISGFVTAVFFLIFNEYLVFNTSFTMVLVAVFINLLGLNFLMLLNYFIGILSFKFYDISAFNMIKQSIFEFITGTFIPLVLFPSWVQGFMKLFPFYYIYYYPAAMIVTGNNNEVFLAITILISWNILMFAVIQITYKRLRKKFEGVGI
jgi:ABC-2 type transport system permease protein